MKYAQLPREITRPLPFYLAMEEYVATKFSDDIFFTWQVEPTVIFGRNQLLETEVDTDYCRAQSINFFRRKSGGGCVYADKGNIMLSFIVTSPMSITDTMLQYAESTAGALRELGIDAQISGRNDVTVCGRKVSGFAAHRIYNRTIVHSTMLYDFNAENMQRAIRPSQQKLMSKGVESVRSHVTSLSECGMALGIDGFIAALRKTICGKDTLELTPTDEELIEIKSRPYFDSEWLFGKNPRSEFVASRRFEGVGEFQVNIHTSGNRITHFILAGDYFAADGATESIEKALQNVELSQEAVGDALKKVDLPNLISGMDNEKFLQLIFN